MDIDWRPLGLVPAGFLLVGAIGHSLIIGGLTLVWKRVELLNDMLLLVLFFLGGVFVPLGDMPGWMAALAVAWLTAGAVIFHRAAQITRRDGTLTRY